MPTRQLFDRWCVFQYMHTMSCGHVWKLHGFDDERLQRDLSTWAVLLRREHVLARVRTLPARKLFRGRRHRGHVLGLPRGNIRLHDRAIFGLVHRGL